MDSYWRDREEQALAEYALTDEQYVEQLNDIYDYMLDQVKKEINGFYSKYATTEGITMAEAQKRVAQVDIDEYERKAKKYVAEKDFSDQANREMRLYNLTMKVNRLQMLEANIGLETVSGFDELSEKLGEDLTERALQEMSRQAGILGATVQNNAKTANSIVGASFHNATFSDRIWMYQAQLRDELDGLLRNGLIQGQNPNELARHINNLFDTGKYNCERLMRTELTRVQSDAQLQSFIAAGFDEYQFNALGNACPVCRELDEQHFRIADAEPGENLPPIHPNCRCAVSAYMDDESYNEWLDSYKDHGLSYEDWLENRPTTVAGGNEALYKEWMDKFLNGDTDVGWDEWLKAKQEGKEPAKKKTTKKKTATTEKKAEPKKTEPAKEEPVEREYRQFETGDQADEMFSDAYEPWSGYIKESGAEDDLIDYTGAGYEDINRGLRTDGESLQNLTEEYREEVSRETESIKQALDHFELEEDIQVYRGCTDAALNNLSVGDTYRDKGFMSSAVTSDSAFGGEHRLVINVPAGTGRGAWLRPISEFENEDEFLIQCGSSFRVDRIDDDGTIYMTMIV